MSAVDPYSYSVQWNQDRWIYIGVCHDFPHLKCYSESSTKALEGIKEMVAKTRLKEANGTAR